MSVFGRMRKGAAAIFRAVAPATDGEAFCGATRRITGMATQIREGGRLCRAGSAVCFLGLAGFGVGAAPTVAVLPVVNVAGANWEQLKARQSNVCNTYLRDQFAARGFKQSPADAVLIEMKREGIDFSDDEQQRRANLFRLGHALHVDYIVLAVITDTRASTNSHILYSDSVGHARAKLWVLDVANEKPILSARRIDSESGGTRLSYDNKGSDREVQAAVNALRDGLKDFLSGWPVAKPHGRRR
ncbi:MAG: hypothetical protein ACYC96_12900 [Fimbriimonadaceae bacterium]